MSHRPRVNGVRLEKESGVSCGFIVDACLYWFFGLPPEGLPVDELRSKQSSGVNPALERRYGFRVDDTR